MKKVKYDLKAC